MGRRSVHCAQVDSPVAAIFQTPVGRISVRNEQARDGGVVPNEGVEALAVDVDDPLQATPCWIFASPSLDRPDHENLAEPYERRGSAVWTLIAVTAVC